VITVVFPALTPKDASSRAPDVALTASERVWQTPAQLGGERPFQIWRLNAPPPFGWRAIAQGDIDCQAFGSVPDERTVAMLSIALPAQDGATENGPAPNALALNISQLLSRDTTQSIPYTHSTNKASGGSPVFDLETGKAQSITVTATSGLTEEEISRMVAENQDYSVAVKKTDDEDGRREIIRRNIREIERLMPVVQERLAGNSLGGDALARAQQALDAARNAVQSSSGAMLSSSAEALDRTLSVFRGIAERG
jgi:molecular chaperone DnaK